MLAWRPDAHDFDFALEEIENKTTPPFLGRRNLNFIQGKELEIEGG